MKILGVALFLLTGCVAGPTLQELETQAMLTGDWSAVEAKERSLARRQQRIGIDCPHGYVSYCEDRIVDKVCTCLETAGVRVLFSTD